MSSCTIQKRLHRPGWHVSWNKNYKSSDKSDFSSEENLVQNSENASQETISNDSELNQATTIPQETIVDLEDGNPSEMDNSKEIKVSSKEENKTKYAVAKEKVSEKKVDSNNRGSSALTFLILVSLLVVLGTLSFITYVSLGPSSLVYALLVFGLVIVFIGLIIVFFAGISKGLRHISNKTNKSNDNHVEPFESDVRDRQYKRSRSTGRKNTCYYGLGRTGNYGNCLLRLQSLNL